MDLQIKTTTFAITFALSTLLIGCSKAPESTASAPTQPTNTIELIQADLVPVQIGRLNSAHPFTGTIQAVNQSSVQAQVSATALNIFADIGQYVNKDQTLVTLNNQDNAARLSQAQANLASAKAQADLNRSVMQRKSNLLQQGFISKLEYEQSQLEYRAQQENVKAMQANVDITQKAAQDTIIKSPISGYITQRQVEVGQTVSLGQTLFEIVDSSQVEIKANMPASEQQSISVGQKLSFNIQGNSQQHHATITRISPVANQVSRNIEFFAKPEQSEKSLSIGSFVNGQVQSSNELSGQMIPIKSVQSPKDKPYVWLVRDKKLLKIPVQILQLEERQEIALVSGLMANDHVSLIKFNEQDHNKAVSLQ